MARSFASRRGEDDLVGLPGLDGRSHPVVDVEDELLRAVLAVALPVRAVDDRERVEDVIDVVAAGVGVQSGCRGVRW